MRNSVQPNDTKSASFSDIHVPLISQETLNSLSVIDECRIVLWFPQKLGKLFLNNDIQDILVSTEWKP